MTIPNKSSFFRSRKSLVVWVLLLSFVFNLFLVGVLAGAIPGLGYHRQFALMGLATSHSKQMIKRMERSLDPEDAAAFHDLVQPQAATLKQAHDQVHEAIEEVVVVYEQDPPDPEALQRAIDHLNQTRAALDNVVGKIMQDSYSKLSQDGRHRLAGQTR